METRKGTLHGVSIQATISVALSAKHSTLEGTTLDTALKLYANAALTLDTALKLYANTALTLHTALKLYANTALTLDTALKLYANTALTLDTALKLYANTALTLDTALRKTLHREISNYKCPPFREAHHHVLGELSTLRS